jgi:ABC-2 type transport system ATP-binding protein
MTHCISVDHLTHQFGELTALSDLSFTVDKGEVFALLGPNGAGKTTTIRVLNGLYHPSAGSVRVLDLDPQTHGPEVRRNTGVLTETNALYERLTARENLYFFGRMYGLPESLVLKRTRDFLEKFGLSQRADDRVQTFSKGMKQRLALARAFLTLPAILFLDEPTASLDPESTAQVHEMIESIRREDGVTVFLCTHHLEEAERLADRLAILSAGRLMALGSLEELDRRMNPHLWVEVDLLEALKTPGELKSLTGVQQVELHDKHLRVEVETEAVIPALVAQLVREKAQITRVTPMKRSLEEIYFSLQAEAREKVA